jgi:hypothetical protein
MKSGGSASGGIPLRLEGRSAAWSLGQATKTTRKGAVTPPAHSVSLLARQTAARDGAQPPGTVS